MNHIKDDGVILNDGKSHRDYSGSQERHKIKVIFKISFNRAKCYFPN